MGLVHVRMCVRTYLTYLLSFTYLNKLILNLKYYTVKYVRMYIHVLLLHVECGTVGNVHFKYGRPWRPLRAALRARGARRARRPRRSSTSSITVSTSVTESNSYTY